MEQIAVTGLAVMGSNLARNFARNGAQVIVHNRTTAKTDALIAEHGGEGDFVHAASTQDMVDALDPPRRIMIMVQAGRPTDLVIDDIAPRLAPGDVVIDGGNARYTDTRRREAALRELGIHFVGAGVSGGEEGALNGPSIMPGGSPESYQTVGPLLERISAKVDGTPCCTYVGTDGAGHFVKMVHNGIEYADMQLIAEAYDLLRRGLGAEPAEIADIVTEWNSGDLESYLVEITAQVLAHVDADTGRPFVDIVLDQAEQKGTGRWTVQSALDLGVPVSGIAEAVFARALSGHPEQRAAAAGLAGPDGSWSIPDRDGFVADVRQALYASKVVAYAQGFQQMRAAADEYNWPLDMGAISTIWRGGCIIRARFLDRIKEAYSADPELRNLLLAPYFRDAVAQGQEAWRRVVGLAVEHGVPVPAFASALAYYDGYRRERGPANLLQGLRDYFGAHTYRRVDRPGTFHTRWAQDGVEEEV